jgi:hypothetical protein
VVSSLGRRFARLPGDALEEALKNYLEHQQGDDDEVDYAAFLRGSLRPPGLTPFFVHVQIQAATLAGEALSRRPRTWALASPSNSKASKTRRFLDPSVGFTNFADTGFAICFLHST